MPTGFSKARNKLNAYVRQKVKLDTPDKNGNSYRQHLEGVRKQMKKVGKLSASQLKAKFKELEPVKLVDGSEYLYAIWDALDDTRPRSEGNPLPITYTEIKSYLDLIGRTLTPIELQVVRSMDDAFLSEAYQLRKEQNQ